VIDLESNQLHGSDSSEDLAAVVIEKNTSQNISMETTDGLKLAVEKEIEETASREAAQLPARFAARGLISG